MNITALKEPVPGVEQGTELIAGLDECLLLGFARLGPAQHAALDQFARVFGGTPLEEPLGQALPAIKRNEFLARHFIGLAAGRTAIQGAQYDALRQRAAAALGREANAGETQPAATSPEGAQTALLSSTQQWLMELALAGFKNLSMELLSPYMATLEQIQAHPSLARAGALLTGFLAELLASTPAGSTELPTFRWADLWARAMIMAQQPPAPAHGQPVSGTFYPLGADVRAHPYFASVLVYGVLEANGERRTARVSFASYKVDVVAGPDIWQLFRPAADALLEALSSRKSLKFSGMQRHGGEDLIWSGKGQPGETFDWIEVARAATLLPSEAPLARHPVQIGELVCLEGCEVRSETAGQAALTLTGQRLRVALERLPAGSEIDAKVLETTNAMVGLLRFDRGEWAVQPLCVRTRLGKKESFVAIGSRALEICKKDKLKTLATLSERAGKLLRQ